VDRKVEEALRLLDEGKASLRRLAKELGIPRSTLHRLYSKWVEERVEALRGEKSRLQAEVRALEEEVARLKREREEVRSSFERQGLKWEEGVAIVREVRDLRAEVERLRSEISKHEEEASHWKGEVERIRSEARLLGEGLFELRRAFAGEEARLKAISSRVRALREEEVRLREAVKTFRGIIFVHELEKRKSSLQAEVEGLEERLRSLRAEAERASEEVEGLKAERERVKSEIEGMLKKAEEEVGRKRKEVEALEAKKIFLECAIRELLESARRVREEVERQRPTTGRGGGPIQELLERLPKIQPIAEGDEGAGKKSEEVVPSSSLQNP